MIVRSPSQIPEVINWLAKHSIVSLDVETTGLSNRKNDLIGFGCASPTDLSGFYIIMREWIGDCLVDRITEADCAPVIEALKAKKLLGWNFAFDAGFILRKFNVDLMPSLHCDVMLAAHTCDENKFQYGLKQISTDLFGASAVAEQADMKESIRANGGTPTEYYKANSELMAKYGLQDNILTCKNWLHWDKELSKQGLTKFFYEDEVMPLMREVTFYMQYKGVPVNVVALEKAREEIIADMCKLEDTIQAQIKPNLKNFEAWYVNRHFPFKFSSAFKDKLGSKLAPPNWPRTKGGGYSFSKADLDRAVKKGLNLDCQFYRIGIQVERPPAELITQIQLELLAEQGTKYIFNLASTDHLKRLFFAEHGSLIKEQPLSRTDKGAPQVNDAFFAQMAAKYEWASTLQVWRSLLKLRGTYIEGVLEKQENGIFYPQFYQHRTVSGRYGSDLQQLPRPYEEGSKEHPLLIKYTNLVREFFIAGPDCVLVDDDYESLEPHIFAHVSGDPSLQAIFNRGHDFYSTIAIATEGLTQYSADKKAPNYLGKINKEARRKAKAYALGLAYGMSSYKLAFELNITQKEAEKLARAYFEAYPELHKWMQRSKKEACEKGRITILSGRIRRFPELPPLYNKYGELLFDSLEMWKVYNETPADYAKAKEAARIAKNCVNNASNVQIQGFAASIVNKASLLITREFAQQGLTAYICASIHDELVVRCAETDANKVAEIVERNMENCTTLTVKLKATASIGTNFRNAKGA